LPFAMSERGELPRIVSLTHKRFRTPVVAILITSAVVLTLTLWSTFARQVNLSVIARLVSYSATCAALLVFRWSRSAPSAMFKAYGGVFAAIAALLLAVWLLSNSSLLDLRDSAIAAAIGLLLYFGYKLTREREVASDARIEVDQNTRS